MCAEKTESARTVEGKSVPRYLRRPVPSGTRSSFLRNGTSLDTRISFLLCPLQRRPVGVTLVEILCVAGILGLLLVGVIGFLNSSRSIDKRLSGEQTFALNRALVMAHFKKDLRSAVSASREGDGAIVMTVLDDGPPASSRDVAWRIGDNGKSVIREGKNTKKYDFSGCLKAGQTVTLNLENL